MDDETDSDKRLVLHVGVHKTATTVVQHLLWDNVAQLVHRRVLHIPRFDTAKSIGWGDLLLETPELFAEQVARFRADDRYDTLLLSHEDTLGAPFVPGRATTYPWARRNLTALRELGGPARVIVGLRPQDEFVESYYLQQINAGGSLSFEQWLADVDLDGLSWRPLVDALDDLYGPQNVVVLDFDVMRQGQDVYLQYFLDSVGVDLGLDPHYPKLRNRSVSERGLRIARSVNPLLSDAAQRRQVRDFLQTRFSNAHYPRPVLLGEARRSAIRERYQDEYRSLVARPGAPTVRPATWSPRAV